MKWYYTIRGAHVHVRVYMNGALCGNLTFRTDEFSAASLLPIETIHEAEVELVATIQTEMVARKRADP